MPTYLSATRLSTLAFHHSSRTFLQKPRCAAVYYYHRVAAGDFHALSVIVPLHHLHVCKRSCRPTR